MSPRLNQPDYFRTPVAKPRMPAQRVGKPDFQGTFQDSAETIATCRVCGASKIAPRPVIRKWCDEHLLAFHPAQAVMYDLNLVQQ